MMKFSAIALFVGMTIPAAAQTSEADLKAAYDICMSKAVGRQPMGNAPRFEPPWEDCSEVVIRWNAVVAASVKKDTESAEKKKIDDVLKGTKKK